MSYTARFLLYKLYSLPYQFLSSYKTASIMKFPVNRTIIFLHMKFYLFKYCLRLIDSFFKYLWIQYFLLAKSYNRFNARNPIELHSFSISNHPSPISNVTNASIREGISSLPLLFVLSICIKPSLLSFLSQWNHFIASVYLRVFYCCQHHWDRRALDHVFVSRRLWLWWLFQHHVLFLILLHLHLSSSSITSLVSHQIFIVRIHSIE